jgi:hypothetical protein
MNEAINLVEVRKKLRANKKRKNKELKGDLTREIDDEDISKALNLHLEASES